MNVDENIPLWKRVGFAVASSRLGGWFFVNLAPHIDRVLLRVTGGRFSMTFGTLPTLILTTLGAKSGQPRTAPLAYLADGERVVLIASRGGGTRHPGWYFNLLADPRATVFVGGREASYVAYEAREAERDELWRKAVALYPGYAIYQQRCGSRHIPVLVLAPADRN